MEKLLYGEILYFEKKENEKANRRVIIDRFTSNTKRAYIAHNIPDEEVFALPHRQNMIWQIVAEKGDVLIVVPGKDRIQIPNTFISKWGENLGAYIGCVLNNDFEYLEERYRFTLRTILGTAETSEWPTALSQAIIKDGKKFFEKFLVTFDKADIGMREERVEALKKAFNSETACLDFCCGSVKSITPGRVRYYGEEMFSSREHLPIPGDTRNPRLLYVTPWKNGEWTYYRVIDSVSEVTLCLTVKEVIAAKDLFRVPMLNFSMDKYGALFITVNWDKVERLYVDEQSYGRLPQDTFSKLFIADSHGNEVQLCCCDAVTMKSAHPTKATYCIDAGVILPLSKNWSIEDAPGKYRMSSIAHLKMENPNGGEPMEVKISMKELKLFVQKHPECHCTNAKLNFSEREVRIS